MSPEQVLALLAVVADQQLRIAAIGAERDALQGQVADLARRLADAEQHGA